MKNSLPGMKSHGKKKQSSWDKFHLVFRKTNETLSIHLCSVVLNQFIIYHIVSFH